jgi:hypothetical protein
LHANLVDANHNVFPEQLATVPFTVREGSPTQHMNVAN